MTFAASVVTDGCRLPPMSSTPARYQPDPRLIDQPDELQRLYNDRGLTIREIASEYADVGRTAVADALHEYGITEDSNSETHSGRRGLAPPQSGGASGPSVSWTQCSD